MLLVVVCVLLQGSNSYSASCRVLFLIVAMHSPLATSIKRPCRLYLLAKTGFAHVSTSTITQDTFTRFTQHTFTWSVRRDLAASCSRRAVRRSLFIPGTSPT